MMLHREKVKRLYLLFSGRAGGAADATGPMQKVVCAQAIDTALPSSFAPLYGRIVTVS
jgi:hypothetical protein